MQQTILHIGQVVWTFSLASHLLRILIAFSQNPQLYGIFKAFHQTQRILIAFSQNPQLYGIFKAFNQTQYLPVIPQADCEFVKVTHGLNVQASTVEYKAVRNINDYGHQRSTQQFGFGDYWFMLQSLCHWTSCKI